MTASVSLLTCISLAPIHLHSHTHVIMPRDRKKSHVSCLLTFLYDVKNNYVAFIAAVKTWKRHNTEESLVFALAHYRVFQDPLKSKPRTAYSHLANGNTRKWRNEAIRTLIPRSPLFDQLRSHGLSLSLRASGGRLKILEPRSFLIKPGKGLETKLHPHI